MRTMTGIVMLFAAVLCMTLWVWGAEDVAGKSAPTRSVVPGRMVCSEACKAKLDLANGIKKCPECDAVCNVAHRMCTACARRMGVCEVCGRKMRPGLDRRIQGKPGTSAVVKGNNQFAFDLYGRLKSQEGNLFLSPYSISTALAMTYAGARGGTHQQMGKVLHFELPDDRLHAAFGEIITDLNDRQKTSKAYQLTVANALWLQRGYPFHDDFLALTRRNYDAALEHVDYARAVEDARLTINEWVEQKTNRKIKDLLQPGVLDGLTRLVLTNAIYFKGSWADEFDKKRTRDEAFTQSDGKKKDVPMMHRTDRFKYAEVEGVQILELPYKTDELSMLVFLPKKVDGLAMFEGKLTAKNLSEWIAGLRKQRVRVSLPRFKMTSQFSLKDTLSSMGMSEAFSPVDADFSGMTDVEKLYIGAVIHKAYVDVNEEGTEAAAATAVEMAGTGLPAPIPVFQADHPFFFIIRDKVTGSVLFMGRVVNPLKSG